MPDHLCLMQRGYRMRAIAIEDSRGPLAESQWKLAPAEHVYR
jgi:hypothetical protein